MMYCELIIQKSNVPLSGNVWVYCKNNSYINLSVSERQEGGGEQEM